MLLQRCIDVFVCACVCVYVCVCWPAATVCEKNHHEVDLSIRIIDTGWLHAKSEKKDTKYNYQRCRHGSSMFVPLSTDLQSNNVFFVFYCTFSVLFLRCCSEKPTNFISVSDNHGRCNQKLPYLCG